MPIGRYGERRAFSTAGSSGYGYSEQLPLPDKPPYTAHIGNLSFDVTESDVLNHFAACSVTNARIVEDRVERKPKGFGYVEFGSLDGLKKALEMNGSQFSGRNIRISVADPPKDRADAREITDWTRKGPLPSLPDQRRGSDRAPTYRGMDSASDAGGDRNERRRPFDLGDGKPRDFSNWERKGPLSPLHPSGSDTSSRPRTQDGPRERRDSPAWGEGRSQDGSRPPRREFQERPQVDRAPTAPETDNQWRAKMRPDPPLKSLDTSRETSSPPSPAASVAPTVRPKLNLQKRTVSEAGNVSPQSAVSDTKPNPFGGARPIDTFAKEKEIEERRQLAVRQKKEQDEKAREKRMVRDTKTDKAAPAAAEANNHNAHEENGVEPRSTKSTASFEILRKASAEDEAEAVGHGDGEKDEEGSKNGVVVEDKKTKPKEIVQDIPTKDVTPSGSGENEAKVVEAESDTSAKVLAEHGWSTVSAKPKNNRKGVQQAARAIAS
ncbi:MAG: hypothetical protein M1826_001731 [Phylliscum demangeonii]|nr:MAG: hypothetical protein M1826_001731 [Phylliscum demangeonii]